MKIKSSVYLILLYLFFSSSLLSPQGLKQAQTKRLNLALSFPRDENVFFQTTPFIALDNEKNIYAVDNRQHIILKLDSAGKLLSMIGREGQGPGDLQLPWLIRIWNRYIFIADNAAISIFNLEGAFKNKFRIFHSIRSMAVSDDKVLLAQTGGGNIIDVYAYDGKKLFSFGNKYSVNFSIYDGWPDNAIEGWLNDGKLLCAGHRIYYITSLFGDIFAYNPKGEMIALKEITKNKFVEENRNLYFKKGIVRKSQEGFFTNFFLIDAYYDQGMIYILLSSSAGNSCGEDIWQIDGESLQIRERYTLFDKNQRDRIWCRSLAVTSDHAQGRLFYISLYDSKDFVINVYK